MIREFLEAVLGEETGRATLWYRPEYGPKKPVNKQFWYDYPAELEAMAQKAQELSGHDVYFSPSLYEQDERTPDAATLASSIWCDADTADPSVFRVKPSYIVQSSDGRWQTYWLLDHAIPATEAAQIARRICYAHRDQGADVSSWSANKLMRVVGTTNTNWDWPHTVSLDEGTGEIYEPEELVEAYSDITFDEITPRTKLNVDVKAPEDLPDFMDAQAKLPADFPIELITNDYHEGMRSEMRWRLIAELVEAGLTDEEVAAIAWSAKCSTKWSEDDPRGIDGLWSEIVKEREKYELSQANPPEPKPEEKVVSRVKPRSKPKRVEILNPEERQRAKEHYKKTWLAEYEDFTRKFSKIYNPTYNMAGAWMALSVLVGDMANLSNEGNAVPLNFFMCIIGPTTSGKSHAKRFSQKVIHKSYSGQGNPDLGDDVSGPALFDALRARHERSTMMSSDEAERLLSNMNSNSGSFQAGLLGELTYLYDGDVPPLIRKGQIEGEWTKTSFGLFLMGTEVKVVEALDRSMFESGFLARMLWFIGDRQELPASMLGVRLSERSVVEGQREILDEWRDRFAVYMQMWSFRKMHGSVPFIWPDSDETADWLQDLTAKLETTLFSDHPHRDTLRAGLTRLNLNVTKMAAMLALADGRDSFTKDDLLVAFLTAETSLGNMVYIFDKVSASEHAKNLDLLETVIASNSLGLHSSEVYRQMSGRGFTKREVDTLAEELRSQRRIKQKTGAGGFGWDWTALE